MYKKKHGSEHGLDEVFDSEVGSDREESDFGTRKIPLGHFLIAIFWSLPRAAGHPMPKALFHMSILVNVSSLVPNLD